MGKISDALERHKEEEFIEAEPLSKTRPKRSVFQEQERAPVTESFGIHEYGSKVVVLSAPDSIATENFKIVRAQLQFHGSGETPQTILVSSSFPGEGKTFVAVNLAVSLAQGIDQDVLLIDSDLRRPQIHEVLGYKNRQGLHEYLKGDSPLEDLVIPTQIDRLSLLTAGEIPSNPTELLSSTGMRTLLEENERHHKDRFVIIDSTPFHATAEAKVLSEYVDGIIFVTMAQRFQRRDIQKAIENLGKDKILGIVFNGYDQISKRHYKYYNKYYEGKS